MPTNPYSDDEYAKEFRGDEAKHRLAFEKALEIRKFEIELYWKRAAYFWTFNAAVLAGFVAIRASKGAEYTDLTVLLSCLGIVFSFGWLCVNRGSKYWQENWEYHVDMLEDRFVGPLYKVVLTRSRPKGFRQTVEHYLTGPSPLSVSKINQLISLFVTILWTGLLVHSLLQFDRAASWNGLSVFLVGLTAVACISFVTIGRTYGGGYWHQSAKRTASIKNESDA